MAWTVLLITAFTDFVITAGGAMVTAITAMSTPDWPPRYVFLISFFLGITAAARTVQQALKATPENSAALKGDVSMVSTASTMTATTVTKTP